MGLYKVLSVCIKITKRMHIAHCIGIIGFDLCIRLQKILKVEKGYKEFNKVSA